MNSNILNIIFETILSALKIFELDTTFRLSKTRCVCKTTLILLIILLNSVYMECSPLPQQDDETPATGRGRRFIDRYTLEDGRDTSLCHYDVHHDINENRIPKTIDRVICRDVGSSCHAAFSCTQLWHTVEVQEDGQTRTLDVQFGCVCCAKHGLLITENSVDTVS